MTGKELKRKRLAMKLSQPQLARRWSITKQTVITWEHKRGKLKGFVDDAWATIEREGAR